MAWIYLFIAGIFEVGFSYFMKECEGLRNIVPSIFLVLCSVFSLFFLTKALVTIPISIAYSVWTSIGAIGACLIGIMIYGEMVSIFKLALLSNMLISIIILAYLK